MTLESLLQDEAFMAHIVGLENGDEVRKAFADKGYELTDEELQALTVAIQNIGDSGELSDEDLDDVAGGYTAILNPKTVKRLMDAVRKAYDRIRKGSKPQGTPRPRK